MAKDMLEKELQPGDMVTFSLTCRVERLFGGKALLVSRDMAIVVPVERLTLLDAAKLRQEVGG